MLPADQGSDTEETHDPNEISLVNAKNSPVNKEYRGKHVVPLSMIGIYIPSGPNIEIDDSEFTYGPKQSKPSESDARSSDLTSCESNSSEETHESMPEIVVNEPRVVSQPKIGHAHFSFESNESDIDDDIQEKRMAKQVKLNKQKGKGNVQMENKPVWNNVQRVNHKNQFVPTTVLTRTGKIPVNTAKASGTNNVSTARHKFNSQADYPQGALKNKGIVDSGCSKHMTRNKAYLAEYQDYNGGPVVFGGSKGYISGKGKIKIGKLDFEDVSFCKNCSISISFSCVAICDKKNKVLFTDTECLVLSPDFKLPDEN
ncbi:hypothetical protein Tco_0667386 [Tanacetum coccineum]